MKKTIKIDGSSLSLGDVVEVARNGARVNLGEGVIQKVRETRTWVEEIIDAENPVYGINTGYGSLADQKISRDEVRSLNRNLILSHAVASGEYLPLEVVRAAILIRANTLAKGYSGVRVEIIEALINLLNRGVAPLIPEQGSMGSSGDLAQLCTLALVFTRGEEADEETEEVSGRAEYQGEVYSGEEAMRRAGLTPVVLEAKEGLAVSNGATFSAAIAALVIYDSKVLLDSANVSLTLTLEALKGKSAAFDERIHAARPHCGQQWVARQIRSLISGSQYIDHSDHIQDAYSLRCAPQVHGSAYDLHDFAKHTIEVEINSATDNPLLVSPSEILSGGNFHGAPVGAAMDMIANAVTRVAAISERRIFRLLDDKLNHGLTPMLTGSLGKAGVNSGLMMTQYSAASLVLECQALSFPNSVLSLPTSANQEDYNANSMTSALNAMRIVKNFSRIVAIELLCAAQARDLRTKQHPERQSGGKLPLIFSEIRRLVPFRESDFLWNQDIEKIERLLKAEEFSKYVEED